MGLQFKQNEGKMRKALSFDDVLLEPQYSDIFSRKDVDLSVDLGRGVELELPIISSPMDTISGKDMAIAMMSAGGMAIIHRYNTIEEQVGIITKVVEERFPANIGAAIGITGNYLERADLLYTAGIKMLCIDVAHGDHTLMREALQTLKNKFNDSVHIMAGNVATLEGFNRLADWGADSIRVGIGGGSICSTRIKTGHGIPTFQSILDCAKSDREAKLIADGGIKNSGDIIKSIAAGADAIITGSLLAGTDETPGPIVHDEKGNQYKSYRGMASRSAQVDWRGKSSSPEGVSTQVIYKGSVIDILSDLEGGIRSGLSYSGSIDLDILRAKAKFLTQTNAGQKESWTHILERN